MPAFMASPSTSVPVTKATPSAMAIEDSNSRAVRALRPAMIVRSITPPSA
jgi:hypothetical protein